MSVTFSAANACSAARLLQLVTAINPPVEQVLLRVMGVPGESYEVNISTLQFRLQQMEKKPNNEGFVTSLWGLIFQTYFPQSRFIIMPECLTGVGQERSDFSVISFNFTPGGGPDQNTNERVVFVLEAKNFATWSGDREAVLTAHGGQIRGYAEAALESESQGWVYSALAIGRKVRFQYHSLAVTSVLKVDKTDGRDLDVQSPSDGWYDLDIDSRFIHHIMKKILCHILTTA